MDTAAAAEIDRQRLLKALHAYFAHQKISIDPAAVVEIPDDKLVTSLAMVCPFEAKEKQALLEAADLAERSRVMTALLELGAFAGQDEGLRH
jgi:Lon protease-like protein